MLESKIEKLEASVAEIQARNQRVEADKAWEMSFARVLLICILTYLIAAWALFMIGVTNYWQSALIPTLGFYLSTLTLPFVKQWWVKRYLRKKHEVR